MIELYCCGPGLLFWLLFFQIRKGLGSWVFKVLLQRFCKTLYRIFATGMFQTSSKCYDRAVLVWSRPIVLVTILPNKEGSWVLGLQGSVAKILQTLYPTCKTLEWGVLFPTILYISGWLSLGHRQIGKSLK